MRADISKAERYEAEVAVFQNRGDHGAQAVRTWLLVRRQELNAAWPSAAGDDLVAMQGEARQIDRLLKLIEHGPTVKPPVEKPQ